MKNDLLSILKKYDYALPPERIAQAPSSPRDSARLMIYNRKTKSVAYDTFRHLHRYLPKNSVLVFNNTKVIPARLRVSKETGGSVELLYIRTQGSFVYALANKKLSPNQRLLLTKDIGFIVHRKENELYVLRPNFPISHLFPILNRYGKTPIPPYIKHSPLSQKQMKEKYQAIFAKHHGSVAAPTASLHFTPRLISSLRSHGHSVAYVTLHVGLGTFSPLKQEHFDAQELHEEFYAIDHKTAHFLTQAKKEGRTIIAVGTTSARTLESASTVPGKINAGEKSTRLFIQEGYQFKFIDALVTNFHVPKSSLLMLVSAFMGRKKLLSLYNEAIKRKFTFFSFGDGMLIL